MITRALQFEGGDVYLPLTPILPLGNPIHIETNPLVLRLSDLIPVVEYTITQQTLECYVKAKSMESPIP